MELLVHRDAWMRGHGNGNGNGNGNGKSTNHPENG
jgi:hypothetical protein